MQILPLCFQSPFMPSQVKAVKQFRNGEVSFGRECAMRVDHFVGALFELMLMGISVCIIPFFGVFKAIDYMASRTSILAREIRWVISPKNEALLALKREQTRLNQGFTKVLSESAKVVLFFIVSEVAIDLVSYKYFYTRSKFSNEDYKSGYKGGVLAGALMVSFWGR